MSKFATRAKAFAPGEIMPMMRGGTPVARYECSICMAILFRSPESLNPLLKYLHALVVYPPVHEMPPFMFIVAEQVAMSGPAFDAMPEELRNAAGQYLGKQAYLCAFTGDGKYNLGSSADLTALEEFEKQALQALRDELGFAEPLRIVEDQRPRSATQTQPSTQPSKPHMGLFDRLSGKTRRFQAALTVALAEYTWDQLSEEQKDAADDVVNRMMATAGIDRLQFHAMPVQYRGGLIAAAIREIGIQPAVQGEEWTISGNPFAIGPDDGEFPELLAEANEYLRRKGIDV